MSLYQTHLTAIDTLSTGDIDTILNLAASLKAHPQPELLKHKILASCFFEPSTRTRLSFEAAMQRLGGSVIGFADAHNTSSKKGETLHDTMKVISGYADAIVIRHPEEGSADVAAQAVDIPVVNAGDGKNQHPTQTLLDLCTIKECQGTLEHLHIAMVGDLKNGRTVHSLTQALLHYRPTLYLVSPDSLAMPDSICKTLDAKGITYHVHADIADVIPQVDVLYMTRLQKERLDGAADYTGGCKLDAAKLKTAKPNLKVLHPLPRVDEITQDVDATPHAYYFEQAKNGLYVREAILALLLSDKIIVPPRI
jgi:aspartate carbamoyltransferase catalytic subunit